MKSSDGMLNLPDRGEGRGALLPGPAPLRRRGRVGHEGEGGEPAVAGAREPTERGGGGDRPRHAVKVEARARASAADGLVLLE